MTIEVTGWRPKSARPATDAEWNPKSARRIEPETLPVQSGDSAEIPAVEEPVRKPESDSLKPNQPSMSDVAGMAGRWLDAPVDFQPKTIEQQVKDEFGVASQFGVSLDEAQRILAAQQERQRAKEAAQRAKGLVAEIKTSAESIKGQARATANDIQLQRRDPFMSRQLPGGIASSYAKPIGAPLPPVEQLRANLRKVYRSQESDAVKESAARELTHQYVNEHASEVWDRVIQRPYDIRTQLATAEALRKQVGGKTWQRWERGSASLASGAMHLAGEIQRVVSAGKYGDTADEQARMYYDLLNYPAFQPLVDNWFDKYVGGTVESGPFMAATLAPAMLTGGAATPSLVAGFLVSYGIEGNLAYQAALDRGENERIARARGVVVGVVNGMIEVGGGSGAKYYKDRVIANAMTRIQKVSHFTGRTVRNALKEGLAEELPQEVVGMVLGGDVPRKEDGSIDWDAVTNRVWDAATIGTISGGIMDVTVTATTATQKMAVESLTRKREPQAAAPDGGWDTYTLEDEDQARLLEDELHEAAKEQKLGNVQIERQGNTVRARVVTQEQLQSEREAQTKQADGQGWQVFPMGDESLAEELANQLMTAAQKTPEKPIEIVREGNVVKMRKLEGEALVEAKERRLYDDLLAKAKEGDEDAWDQLVALNERQNLPTYEELLDRAIAGDMEAVDAIRNGKYRNVGLSKAEQRQRAERQPETTASPGQGQAPAAPVATRTETPEPATTEAAPVAEVKPQSQAIPSTPASTPTVQAPAPGAEAAAAKPTEGVVYSEKSGKTGFSEYTPANEKGTEHAVQGQEKGQTQVAPTNIGQSQTSDVGTMAADTTAATALPETAPQTIPPAARQPGESVSDYAHRNSQWDSILFERLQAVEDRANRKRMDTLPADEYDPLVELGYLKKKGRMYHLTDDGRQRLYNLNILERQQSAAEHAEFDRQTEERFQQEESQPAQPPAPAEIVPPAGTGATVEAAKPAPISTEPITREEKNILKEMGFGISDILKMDPVKAREMIRLRNNPKFRPGFLRIRRTDPAQKQIDDAMKAFRAMMGEEEVEQAKAVPAPTEPVKPGDEAGALAKLKAALKNAKKAVGKIRQEQRDTVGRKTGSAWAQYRYWLSKGVPYREAWRRSTAALKGENAEYGGAYESVRDQVGDAIPVLDDMMQAVIEKQYYLGETLPDAMDKLLDGHYLTRGEARMLAKYFPELADAIYTRVPLFDKLWDTSMVIANVPRTTLSGFLDMSGIGRQGRALGQKHPIEYAKFVRDYWKAFASDKFAHDLQQQIEDDPYYDEAKHYLLQLQDWGDTHIEAEERAEGYVASPMITDLIKKIPGIGDYAAFPFEAAERSFVTALNAFRLSVYSNIVSAAEASGKPLTGTEKARLTQAINDLSGRSSLTGAGTAKQLSSRGQALRRLAPFLNAVFFSPRFIASRVGVPYRILAGGAHSLVSGRVTPEFSEVALASASMAATNFGIMMLAKMAAMYWGDDDDVEADWDLRSSDGGKVRVGNQRFDLWAGFLQPAQFLYRMATGQRKSESGRVYEVDRLKLIGSEIRKKTSPVISLIYDTFKGYNFKGEAMPQHMEMLRKMADGTLTEEEFYEWANTTGREAWERLGPLIVQDASDAFEQCAYPWGVAGTVASFVGVGVQTYDSSPQQKVMDSKDELALRRFGTLWDELSPSRQKAIRRDNPEMKEAEIKAKAERKPMESLDLTGQNRTAKKMRQSLSDSVRKALGDRAVSVGVGRVIDSDFYLNEDRYEAYQEETVKRIETYVSRRIQTPSYTRATTVGQQKMLKKDVDRAREEARHVITKRMEQGSL